MTIPSWDPSQLDERVGAGVPVLAELRADWCPQCNAQEAALTRVALHYGDRVAIGTIDVGEHPAVPDEFSIQGLPAFLLYTRGRLHRTETGYRRAPQLQALLDDLLSQ